MRWPATGLSNPPLNKSTPRRATLNPHILRVDAAGFRLVLAAADERAAIREDCEAVALHVRDEHPARSTGRAERRQAIRDGLHIDRAVVDRVEGNRIAPAERSEDLRPLCAQVLTLALNASRTIGAAPDVNPLDVRMPSVAKKEAPGGRLAREQPKCLARLNRPHHGGGGVEDPRRLARWETSRRRRLRVETTETRGDRSANRERHPIRRDGPAVHERDVRLNRRLVEQESSLEIVRSVDDDVHVVQDVPDRRRVDILRERLDLDLRVHGPEALRGGIRLRPVHVRFGVERLPLGIRELDDDPLDPPEVPDPRPGQQVGGDAPQGAQPNHDGSCPGELSLALDTNLGEDLLSTISIGRKHTSRKDGRLMAFRPAAVVAWVAPQQSERRRRLRRMRPGGSGSVLRKALASWR